MFNDLSIYRILIAAGLAAFGKYLEKKSDLFIVCYISAILSLFAPMIMQNPSSEVSVNSESSTAPAIDAPVTVTPADQYEEMIYTAYDGILAPASDFLFPKSSQEYLSYESLNQIMESSDKYAMRSISQRAINEIFARYGYTFHGKTATSREAINLFSGKDWYEKCRIEYNKNPLEQDVLLEEVFNDVERANVYLIWDWQERHELPPLDA